MRTKVSEILKQKGHDVITVGPAETVEAVTHVLARHRIGAALVTDQANRIAGIISERDIARSIAEHGSAALAMTAADFMTREVKTCSPDDELVDLMEVMTRERIRHLPVVRGDGMLDGLISIGDVVKSRLAEVRFEMDQLRQYITSP
ncbi:MAG: CBS domain-containing protein [Deltaproteobacteria bacterium]|nr:CBS domain-containing protein [Deltaproteobacteria bacterium]